MYDKCMSLSPNFDLWVQGVQAFLCKGQAIKANSSGVGRSTLDATGDSERHCNVGRGWRCSVTTTLLRIECVHRVQHSA